MPQRGHPMASRKAPQAEREGVIFSWGGPPIILGAGKDYTGQLGSSCRPHRPITFAQNGQTPVKTTCCFHYG